MGKGNFANESGRYSQNDNKDIWSARKEEIKKTLTDGTKLKKKEEEKLKKELAALEWALRKKQIDDANELELQKAKARAEANAQRYMGMVDEIVNHPTLGVKTKITGALKYSGAAMAETVKDKLKTALTTDISDSLASLTSKVTSQLDTIIDDYISKQQSMVAHLNGSSYSLKGITDNLNNALSTSSLVSQKEVYNKLAELVKSGIVYNVEQRAFLQTIADDIDLTFNVANSKLVQLIQIQQKDITSNRLAIEYSLQTFLNQNYETSTYIKEAFENVSDALLETQSLMNPAAGLQLEATLQTWLGSLYSSGVSNSTVTSLASAFNALGSGDVSNLGTGISNLVLMGVARAGLDYGQLLTNGITASNANQIMQGITTYLSEMGAQSSNVVKSQLSSIFGVNIADLAAIGNLKTTSGGATTDINSALLNQYGSFVPLAQYMSNTLSNLMYTWGTNVADNEGELLVYNITKAIANNFGPMFENLSFDLKLFGTGFGINIGKLIEATPLLALVPSFISTVSDAFSSSGPLGSAASIFSALASADSATIKYAGAGLGTTAGVGTSGSVYMGNTDTSNIFDASKTSMTNLMGNSFSGEEETWTATDIYNKMMLWETAFPDNRYKIDPEENVVRVNYGEDDLLILAAQQTAENTTMMIEKLEDIISKLEDLNLDSGSFASSLSTTL